MQRGLLLIGLVIVLALVVWAMRGARLDTASSPSISPRVTEPQAVSSYPAHDDLRGTWRLVEYSKDGKRHRLAVDDVRSRENQSCILDIQGDSAHLSASPNLDLAGVFLPPNWSVRNIPRENRYHFNPVDQSPESPRDRLVMSATLVQEQLRLYSDESQAEWVFERQNRRPTTVFLIHGTYDAASDWTREVPEAVTFASELQRGLGTKNLRIEPFLWRTSVQHPSREQAATNLAALLDDLRFADDRVILIGHSHGGNVCLSAAGLCRRRVDLVVCLATPHMHVLMQNERKESAALPVYLTPKGRANIGTIVNLWAQSDPVIAQRVNAFLGPWAAVRSGLDEQTAIHAVHDWRREQNFPRLIHEDGPIKELIAEYFGTRSKSHLTTLPRLSAADHEFELACEAKDLKAHSVIHSCRMGRVLGAAIRDNFGDEMVEYLAGLWLSADSDTGGPVVTSTANDWWDAHQDGVHFNGWLLKSVEVDCKSQTGPNGKPWDSDGSWPDIYVCCKVDDAGNQISSGVGDRAAMRWQPWLRFPPDTPVPFEIRDRDRLSSDELMGQFQIPAESDVRSPFIDDNDVYSLRAEWIRLHD